MNIPTISAKAYAWRGMAFLYLLAVVLFTCAFIGLHHMANQVPQKFIAEKLARDFHFHNLSVHNYPFAHHGAHSILSNVGQNQFTECAVLLSVLSTQSNSIQDAVLPRTAVRKSSQACDVLKNTVGILQTGGEFASRPLRSQYWWGARPVYSFALRYFSVYQTRELIRNATALAYAALAVALLFVSPALFWLSSPLLIFGTMFSGITYYSEVILGVPYLWAIVAATIIAALHAAKARTQIIHLTVFCSGMVSSYLWLLDGHTMLLVTWLMIIGYFAQAQRARPVEAGLSMLKHVLSYCAGFIAAYFSGQLIKMSYLGFGRVWHTFTDAAATRVSDVGPADAQLDLSIVIERVWGIGYWWTGLFRHELLWQLVLWSSALAACAGIIIATIRSLKGNRYLIAALLVCALVALSVLARLYILQNHAVIHAFFIGRYMFIPLAMGWAMLVISLSGLRHSQIDNGR